MIGTNSTPFSTVTSWPSAPSRSGGSKPLLSPKLKFRRSEKKHSHAGISRNLLSRARSLSLVLSLALSLSRSLSRALSPAHSLLRSRALSLARVLSLSRSLSLSLALSRSLSRSLVLVLARARSLSLSLALTPLVRAECLLKSKHGRYMTVVQRLRVW